jgi:hypothetical protein
MRPVTNSQHRTLLLAVVVSIALGVLGMHALSPHSTGMTDTTVSGEATMSTAHGGHAAATTAGSDVDEALEEQPAAPTHDMDNMVMLCVAMVTSAAIALLMLRLTSRVPASWVLARARLRAVFAHPALAVTSTGPPPVWAFSVIRC